MENGETERSGRCSLVTRDRLIHTGKGMLNESWVCDSTRGVHCTLVKLSCTSFSFKGNTGTHTLMLELSVYFLLDSFKSCELVDKDFLSYL